MTQTSRQATDFATHLGTRLDELDAQAQLLPGDQPFRDALRSWITGVREDIREYCDAERYTLESPIALVHTAGDPSPGSRHQLTSNIVASQVIRWELDVDLPPGATVQLTDVGEFPINVLLRVITAYTTRISRPTVARYLLQANVHCPECQEFGCHRIQIPLTPWNGFIWRRCECSAHWRQHPQGL